MHEISRILGEYDCGNRGPLFFITGGIHGNEPSGVYALETIFKILHKEKPVINGKVIGVSGNREALMKGVRFIDEDLNRTWTKENISSEKIDSHEKKEMFEIIKVLEQYPDKEFSKRYFLDCHTTSSDSEPYISVQEMHDNDQWAHRFPTNIIRGFSDIVKGDIDEYESKTGLTGFVFEAGQNESKQALKYHEGMIWLALNYACELDFEDLNEYPKSVKMIEAKRKERKTFEIEYRHGIEDTDDFKMEPGYKNFQKIVKGELLAHQNGKPVYSNWNAFIFMPLYQDQGNDGFFVVKEVC